VLSVVRTVLVWNITSYNGSNEFGDPLREAFREGGIVHFSVSGQEPRPLVN
jgi:hypothetical protein